MVVLKYVFVLLFLAEKVEWWVETAWIVGWSGRTGFLVLGVEYATPNPEKELKSAFFWKIGVGSGTKKSRAAQCGNHLFA